ncbi:MAG: hypothetical protein JSS02_25190, partial [Planctomycetes bacterium]|nr:hypothetical protein [Planctomycetota bacterium]
MTDLPRDSVVNTPDTVRTIGYRRFAILSVCVCGFVAVLVWLRGLLLSDTPEPGVPTAGRRDLTELEREVSRGRDGVPTLLAALARDDVNQRRLALVGLGRIGPA